MQTNFISMLLRYFSLSTARFKSDANCFQLTVHFLYSYVCFEHKYTAIQLGCDQVMLETDSISLEQAVNSEAYDLSALGAVFREIKFRLRCIWGMYKTLSKIL